ncbi:MAG TPA: DUF5615 family PIN-like protein [Woeseiaceae bacterium]|nr:DUF5615 family PIN-like protein [Woeseiaceae bacterium]
MGAEKKKSKKRSAANFKPPPSGVRLYLDRNLGKHVIAEALRAVGIAVEVHDDHLAANAPDEEWIALVGRRQWLAITKDKNIRYRTAELEAIKEHGAKVLVVRAKNATGQDIADILIKASVRIQRFAHMHPAPFVAGIDRSGRVSMYDLT